MRPGPRTSPGRVRPSAPLRTARVVAGLLAAGAVLLGGAACSSPTSPAAPAPAAPAPASPAPAAPDGPAPLAVGSTHVFADGNAVTVAAPRTGDAVPGSPVPRTLEVIVTVRNGSPAAEDLSRFGFDATTADDRDATQLDEEEPVGTLAPGQERTFPLRFALPDTAPTEVTLDVSKADQTVPGEDVPGSDEAPGASVEFAMPV